VSSLWEKWWCGGAQGQFRNPKEGELLPLGDAVVTADWEVLIACPSELQWVIAITLDLTKFNCPLNPNTNPNPTSIITILRRQCTIPELQLHCWRKLIICTEFCSSYSSVSPHTQLRYCYSPWSPGNNKPLTSAAGQFNCGYLRLPIWLSSS
jgi:hypothetical protein